MLCIVLFSSYLSKIDLCALSPDEMFCTFCQKQLCHINIYDTAIKVFEGRSNWLSIYPDYFFIVHELTFFCFYHCMSSEAAVKDVTLIRCVSGSLL